MVYYTITLWRPRFSRSKTRGWEDPEKVYKMLYDETLVRLDLPRDVWGNKEDFVLQNAEGKMEEKGLQKRTRFFAVLLEQLTLCNHIILEWDRAGFDVCLFWYKLPRNYYRGLGIPGGWSFSSKGPCGTSNWRRNEGSVGLHVLLWAPHWKRTLEKWKKRSGWSSVPDVPVLRGITPIG